ncbi:MAG: hypothetical protein HQK59_07585 [Deltaproteobacteria bacterium]|nr:hypothetical protein [Deltaproteobacteria bacterium]
MKISIDNQITPSLEQTQKPKQTQPGTSFADILKQVSAAAGPEAASQLAPGLDQLNMLRQTALNPLDVANSQQTASNLLDATGFQPTALNPLDVANLQSREAPLQATESVLSLLDNYAAALGDPNMSLKDIAPIVSAMDAKVQSMMQTMEQLPDGDNLKDLMAQTAITTNTEVIKFNRGDYLPG